MKSLIPGACSAFILLSLGARAADEKGYVLATGELPPAGTVMEQKIVTEVGGVLTITKNGKSSDGTWQRKDSETRKLSIVEPDKYLEELVESQVSGETAVGGSKVPVAALPNPLLNLPVVVQKFGTLWKAKLQDGSLLSDEQAAKRTKAPSLSKALAIQLAVYGKEPRKPGDKWQIDAATLPQFIGISHPSGSISCEFVEVREVESGPAAAIRMTVDLKGTRSKDKPEAKIDHSIGHVTGEIVELRSLRYQVTLEQQIKGNMEMDITSSSSAEVKMSGPINASEKITIQKP